jgi:outer membrane protein insertion porin family
MRLSRKLLWIVLGSLLSVPAWAFEAFIVENIRVEGLQRLEVGTVLTYLPLSTGDEINEQSGQQAIRTLYGTGLFQDVGLEREGSTLVIRVQERPSISSLSIEGNKKLGGDELKKGLADAGLAEGELFKRALLDGVEQELRRQYYANGFYGVQIKTQVVEEPDNRVKISIDITEGEIAKISQINIVGNAAFTDEELLTSFKLEPTKVLAFFQKTDRYSKQQLLGDLEGLGSYYQDRGYLRFSVDSVQVALSPDKKDIFITVNVSEGRIYKVRDFTLSGNLVLTEEQLRRMITIKPGDTFSRREATESGNRITAILSDIGYAFAKVEPLPEIHEDSEEVSINFRVEPGKRVYVRRINFSGHAKTNDETLRREMRQLEGAPFSRTAVERSRTRLARLPYIEEAEVETKPVAGTEDQVDVSFTVKERPPGSIQLGVGFSDASGFLISGSVTHTNFRGTGDRVEFTAQNNEFSQQISASWTDPYATSDGVSRTIAAFFRKSEQVVRFSSGFNVNALGTSLTYGLPLTEYSSLRVGLAYEQTAVDTFAGITSDELLDFTVRNGTKFDAYELRTGISRDTRNRTVFATSGMLNRFNVDFVLPGSDLTYYRGVLDHEQYIPLRGDFIFQLKGRLGYADGYGDDKDIPPYENFFAGGFESVRGFRDGTLGPRDTPPPGQEPNPFGGKLVTTLQSELILPTPLESNNKSTRLSVFFDIGNVFADPGDFDISELRQSTGVAFYWLTPFFGVLKVSFAVPLNEESQDETDQFQISFGVGL